MDLSGKTALVLGAVKGIGKGIALSLAEAGVNVAATWFDWPESRPALETGLADTGAPHLVHQVDLTDTAAGDADYDVDDLLPPVRNALSLDGSLYAVPFYGESSFVMYNQEIMDAAGVTVPEAPTWDEIAEIARQVNTDDVAGICLRGLPGWGDLGASLTTVVNTFGGTLNVQSTPGYGSVFILQLPYAAQRTNTNEEAKELLAGLGMPFRK